MTDKILLAGNISISGGRNRSQRASDLPIIAALHLQGKNPGQIAAYINEIRPYTITASIVREDLREIRQEWINQAVTDYAAARAEELQKISQLEAAAWDAWERSWKDAEQYEIEQSEESVSPIDLEEQAAPTKTKRNRERKISANRLGQASYLQVIQWCIEKRCRIYGFDAPKQLEVTWRKDIEALGLRPDDIIEGLSREIEQKMLESGS